MTQTIPGRVVTSQKNIRSATPDDGLDSKPAMKREAPTSLLSLETQPVHFDHCFQVMGLLRFPSGIVVRTRQDRNAPVSSLAWSN